MYLSSPNVFKLAPALETSYALGDRWRLSLGSYRLQNDEHHTSYNGRFAHGTDYTNYRFFYSWGWGFNVGVERTLGRKPIGKAFFLYGGLGYLRYRTLVSDRLVSDGVLVRGSDQLIIDRRLLLETGIGKQWKLGPGQLRAAFTVALVGYRMEKANPTFSTFPTVGVSLSYQFRIGRKAKKPLME